MSKITCFKAYDARGKVPDELDTDDPGIISEAHQVAEVDAAADDLGVGEVAAEQGDLVLCLIPGVTQPQTDLKPAR